MNQKYTPQQMTGVLEDMIKDIQKSKRLEVAVGLPVEKMSGAVYSSGESVVDVAITHEYGAPSEGIPQRSFLRTPFIVKGLEMEKRIDKSFKKMLQGYIGPEVAIEEVGIKATDIVKAAFESAGYGNWKPNSAYTIADKGSSMPLVDTGTLKNSITYAVRGA